MRILGTLIAAAAASATVAGIPVGPDGTAEIRQRIAVMPESPGLYQRLTVTENLEYFARLYGLPRRRGGSRGRWRRPRRPGARPCWELVQGAAVGVDGIEPSRGS